MNTAPAVHAGIVARCYHGDGAPKDRARVAFWYRRLAEQGDARAQETLAECYEFGSGVAEDHAQAVVRYRRAWKGGP